MPNVQMGKVLVSAESYPDRLLHLSVSLETMTPMVLAFTKSGARSLSRFLRAPRQHYPAVLELPPWRIAIEATRTGRRLKFEHAFDDDDLAFSFSISQEELIDIAECIGASLKSS